jgi:hypothetical protein
MRVITPATTAGGTANTDFPPVPEPGKVVEVVLVLAAAITINATNFRRIRILNTSKGNAVVASKDFSAGTAAAATAIPITLAAGDPPFVSEGDVLRVESTPVGTGQVDPGGQVFATIQQLAAQLGQL